MSFCINVAHEGGVERLSFDIPTMGHEVLAMVDAGGRGALAWRVNDILRPMSWFVDDDAEVSFVDTSSYAGKEIYRNTLSFITAIAAKRALGSDIFVKHSVSDSYYCELAEGEMTDESADALRIEMRKIVAGNSPIHMAVLSHDKAVRVFERQGSVDSARLMHWIGSDPVTLSRCLGHYAYFGSPLAPTTAYVSEFDIMPCSPGFLLRFPDEIGRFDKDVPHVSIERELLDVFNEYSNWLRLLGVTTLADLHEHVASGSSRDLIMVSEAFHSNAMAKAADVIASKGSVRLVCLAGPSSSGKTTTSRRLSTQLKALGKRPVTIELDNYYLERDKAPVGKGGAPDFEALEAIDVELINEHIERLLDGDEVDVPKFDFMTGTRKPGRRLKLSPDDMLIIEGIHGLNDAVSRGVPRDAKHKIFICPLTGINLDSYNRIGTTDRRLLRRIVRDHRTRGYSPERTLKIWPSVVRGAHKYIFPYEREADVLFNTSLAYEISVLRGYAEPLLRSIREGSPEYAEARRLLTLLSFVPTIPSDDIPNTSIIREFIGGSCFE